MWIVCILVVRSVDGVSFGVASLLAIKRRTELAAHLVVGSSFFRLTHGISLPRHTPVSCHQADVLANSVSHGEHRVRSPR